MRPSAGADPRPTWAHGVNVLVGDDTGHQAIEESAGLSGASRMRTAARTVVDLGSFLIVVVFTALLFIPMRFDTFRVRNKSKSLFH